MGRHVGQKLVGAWMVLLKRRRVSKFHLVQDILSVGKGIAGLHRTL